MSFLLPTVPATCAYFSMIQVLYTDNTYNTPPVLLNEVFIFFVWIDGFEGIGHLIMNTHHFILEQTGQVKIFLQNLLPRGKT